MEFQKNSYSISTEKSKLDLELIYGFLKSSYWAKDQPFEKIKTSIDNSLCFGLYKNEKQIGFARVLTDMARIAHLADVFILEPYRGMGLGKWLLQCIMAHPELENINKWMLATKDAHSLYKKFGFKTLKTPEFYMEK